MGILANDEDEENACRTVEDLVGRSVRRGTDKALQVLTLGLPTRSDPAWEMGPDAAEELVTTVIPRCCEPDD